MHSAIDQFHEQTNFGGWQAELSLGFRQDRGKTVLCSNKHRGPLVVQRPFYPEGDKTCHVYVIHPPGGIVAGDELRIEVYAEQDAKALLTTPAATKIYRSDGAHFIQEQRLSIAHGAALEWFPQETIVYKDARGRACTRVDLEGNAQFIGWEIVCLGRPAAGESFTSGSLFYSFEIWKKRVGARHASPLLVERGPLVGGEEMLAAQWGLGGHPVYGIMTCVVDDSVALPMEKLLQTGHENSRDGLFTASLLREVLVCRYLGDCTASARKLFQALWVDLRPLILKREACPPRIWAT